MGNKRKKLLKSFYGMSSSILTVLFSLLISLQLFRWLWYVWWKYKTDAFPEIDINQLPKHFDVFLFAIISVIFGHFMYFFTKKMIIEPIRDIYHAIDKIASDDYSVKLTPKGIPPIKKVAAKINIMVRELESVETMRNDLINNISHEFKTPLNSIAGFAKLIKHEKSSTECRNEYADIIIKESERMTNLSNNVLHLTRLDNMTILPQVKRFNVSEQIRLVIVLLKDKWENKNITINFDCDEYYLEGNEPLVQQIWINLLDNAIKFSGDKSEINIEIKEVVNHLVFTISDEGCGMNEEAAKHAFERFYQADIDHTSTGNGIGLAITKRICNLHSGDIRIKSTCAKGTSFEVALPVKQ